MSKAHVRVDLKHYAIWLFGAFVFILPAVIFSFATKNTVLNYTGLGLALIGVGILGLPFFSDRLYDWLYED